MGVFRDENCLSKDQREELDRADSIGPFLKGKGPEWGLSIRRKKETDI